MRSGSVSSPRIDNCFRPLHALRRRELVVSYTDIQVHRLCGTVLQGGTNDAEGGPGRYRMAGAFSRNSLSAPRRPLRLPSTPSGYPPAGRGRPAISTAGPGPDQPASGAGQPVSGRGRAHILIVFQLRNSCVLLVLSYRYGSSGGPARIGEPPNLSRRHDVVIMIFVRTRPLAISAGPLDAGPTCPASAPPTTPSRRCSLAGRDDLPWPTPPTPMLPDTRPLGAILWRARLCFSEMTVMGLPVRLHGLVSRLT